MNPASVLGCNDSTGNRLGSRQKKRKEILGYLIFSHNCVNKVDWVIPQLELTLEKLSNELVTELGTTKLQNELVCQDDDIEVTVIPLPIPQINNYENK